MKPFILIALAFTLCSCESAEEHKAKWVANCTASEFTSKQCEVLYSIVKNSDDNANTAQALMGASIAIGASSGIGRR